MAAGPRDMVSLRGWLLDSSGEVQGKPYPSTLCGGRRHSSARLRRDGQFGNCKARLKHTDTLPRTGQGVKLRGLCLGEGLRLTAAAADMPAPDRMPVLLWLQQ